MKNKKLVLALVMILAFGILVGVMGGCAPQQKKNSESDAAAATANEYPTDSLKAKHTIGQLDNASDYSNKLCLGCHERAEINAATENYGGTADFNPHQSHNAAGDCVSCHVVETTSILTCNECHNENPPEGWESAERGVGPLHDLSKRGK